MVDQDANPLSADAISWGIDSNLGWSHFDCTRAAGASLAGSISCRIRLWGEFWDRGVPSAAAKLVPDFRVELLQVQLSEDALEALHDYLDRWLTSYEHFECELASYDALGQSLVVSVGKREDTIYTKEKPAITFTYSAGKSIYGEWSFVIDQSCVWLCRDALKSFLQR